MMKEIHEQPKAVQDTLNSVIKNGAIDLSSVGITEDEIKNFEQIYIVACGSAWHVGMAAQYVLEDIADIPVRVELASEFRYRKMPINQKALVIVISQSGETADTLGKVTKNNGNRCSAYVPEHHEAIVSPEIARAAHLVASSSKKCGVQDVVVIRQGALKGFIGIHPNWSGINAESIRSLCLSTYLPEEVPDFDWKKSV